MFDCSNCLTTSKYLREGRCQHCGAIFQKKEDIMDEFGDTIFADDDLMDMQALVHKTAKDHGWWEGKDKTVIPEKLALIHSEISEALEEYRNGNMVTYFSADSKPEGFGVELADAIIRILDLAAFLGLDIADLVSIKHNYNLTRSYRHGGKLA